MEISHRERWRGTDSAGSATLEVPDISTEELTTSVTVRDGSAVVLGGAHYRRYIGQTKDGIPGSEPDSWDREVIRIR